MCEGNQFRRRDRHSGTLCILLYTPSPALCQQCQAKDCAVQNCLPKSVSSICRRVNYRSNESARGLSSEHPLQGSLLCD